MSDDTGVDLFWLPLGADGQFVRWNGRVYEAVRAHLQGRPVTELYHSALQVSLPEGRWVVEMTPVWSAAAGAAGTAGADRGVVGARWAGRSRWFRYEIRSWRGGAIGDVGEAVASPIRMTSDPAACRRLLAVLPGVPAPVWGRDELAAGEMWNSNSVISWALVRSGLSVAGVHPPEGGTAPGWDAGTVVAARQLGRDAPPTAPTRPRAV